MPTVTTLTGHTAQTGNTYALAAGGDGFVATKADPAAILADTNELQTDDVPGLIAALNDVSTAQVNAEVDTALADYDGPTNAEMTTAFTEIKGATWASSTDTLEAIRDRGDAAWVTGSGGDATEAKQDIITTHLTDIKGGGFDDTTDTLEDIRDAVDTLVPGSAVNVSGKATLIVGETP